MLCVTRKRLAAGLEAEAGGPRQVLDREGRELLAGVQSRADGGRPQIQFVQPARGVFELVCGPGEAGGVTAELLAERHRHGVLQVRAPDLENGFERVGLLRQGRRERSGRLHQRRMAEQQREPRRRREDVVRGLSHVDVIVRMHDPVLTAGAAEDLRRPVGQHLVRVHVVRRAGARLVDIDDELVAQGAAEDFIGGADDGVANPRRRGDPAPRWPGPPLS